jgi:hypothetical protein
METGKFSCSRPELNHQLNLLAIHRIGIPDAEATVAREFWQEISVVPFQMLFCC